MSDDGLPRLGAQIQWLRDEGGGRVRTSDVSGMDWSAAQVRALDGYRCLKASKRDPDFCRAIASFSWAMLKSTYIIGSTVRAQLSGTRTGSFPNSWERKGKWKRWREGGGERLPETKGHGESYRLNGLSRRTCHGLRICISHWSDAEGDGGTNEACGQTEWGTKKNGLVSMNYGYSGL